MTEWTPGPWPVDEDARVLACDDRSTIICLPSASPSNPTVMADAHLLAAAPDLYAALESITEHLVGVMSQMEAQGHVRFANGVGGIPTIKQARAALIKARGDGT